MRKSRPDCSSLNETRTGVAASERSRSRAVSDGGATFLNRCTVAFSDSSSFFEFSASEPETVSLLSEAAGLGDLWGRSKASVFRVSRVVDASSNAPDSAGAPARLGVDGSATVWAAGRAGGGGGACCRFSTLVGGSKRSFLLMVIICPLFRAGNNRDHPTAKTATRTAAQATRGQGRCRRRWKKEGAKGEPLLKRLTASLCNRRRFAGCNPTGAPISLRRLFA